MFDWASLTVPEVVSVFGLGGTLLAVYKGVLDGKKANTPAAAIGGPVNAVVDVDKRYVEAMEALTEAFNGLATANTTLGHVNQRQALAMEGIAEAVKGWIHKAEREKDSERMEALELQMARIYNVVAGSDSRPVRKTAQDRDK